MTKPNLLKSRDGRQLVLRKDSQFAWRKVIWIFFGIGFAGFN
jgi:hypothetical protein